MSDEKKVHTITSRRGARQLADNSLTVEAETGKERTLHAIGTRHVTFYIAPGVTLNPGDLVGINMDGYLEPVTSARLYRSIFGGLPPTAVIDAENGTVTTPQQFS